MLTSVTHTYRRQDRFPFCANSRGNVFAGRSTSISCRMACPRQVSSLHRHDLDSFESSPFSCPVENTHEFGNRCNAAAYSRRCCNGRCVDTRIAPTTTTNKASTRTSDSLVLTNFVSAFRRKKILQLIQVMAPKLYPRAHAPQMTHTNDRFSDRCRSE